MRIIFAGSIGRLPVGGHAWVDMQYLLGLRALGHDVTYLEECGEWSVVYHWQDQALTTDLAYPTQYIRRCLEPIGFGDRWIYRAASQSEGMPLDTFLDRCRDADLFIVRAVSIPLWRTEYTWPRIRVFIDMDPLFTQVQLAKGDPGLTQTVGNCQHLFTIGQRIGREGCLVPTLDRPWLKTVPPVFLDEWPFADDGNASHFTTIMQWRSYREVEHHGVRYGNKDIEFRKFIDLPRHTGQPLRLALTGGPQSGLTECGWDVAEGWVASETPDAYRAFIQQSRGEFTVAKHGYVAARCGWLSDRTVCYLASGRPALVQDTGLADWLPVGKGLLTFSDIDEARQGIEAINADYEGHRRAARRLAEDCFASNGVLSHLLEAAI